MYGYPKDQALKVDIDVISDFLLENEMTVYIVISDKATYKISEKLFSDIAEYIDDNYVDEHTVIDIVFNIVLELLGVDTSGKLNAKESYHHPLCAKSKSTRNGIWKL